MKKLKRMGNIFLEPAAVFEELKGEKDWVFPLVIIIIMALISSLLVYSVVSSPEYIEQMEQEMREEMTEEDREGQEVDMSSMTYVYFISIVVTGVAGAVITYLVLALLLWLPGKFGLKEYNYSRLFSASAYIGIVGGLGSILQAVLVYMQRDVEVGVNLGLLFPGAGGITGTILEQISIFTVWAVILAAVAFSVFYDIRKWKTIPAFLLLWSLWTSGVYLVTSTFGG
ncbi:MAG: YIP1 family protein [Halanaerobiaceae bacterium]